MSFYNLGMNKTYGRNPNGNSNQVSASQGYANEQEFVNQSSGFRKPEMLQVWETKYDKNGKPFTTFKGLVKLGR